MTDRNGEIRMDEIKTPHHNGGPNGRRRLPAGLAGPSGWTAPGGEFTAARARRRRRMGIIFGVLAVAFFISSYWMVSGGWVRPGEVVWRFPWSHQAYKSDF